MTARDFTLDIPIEGRVKVCLDLLVSQGLKGKVIIDIGSSFGWLEHRIKNSGAKKIIGVEPEVKALEYAKKNVAGVEFLRGDALNIPVQDKSADIVLLFDVLEHIPVGTEALALKEINRVLKKGGVLLLSTPHNHILINLLDPAWYFGHRHYSISQAKKIITDAKFELKEINLKGNVWSSLYLIWLYSAKILTGNKFVKSRFFQQFEERGYRYGQIGTIFIKAISN